MSDVIISAAGPGDVPAIEALLEACGLPTDGLEEILGHLIVARAGDRLLGCVGLEAHGEACVLRSLAVIPAARGTGVARRLIGEIQALAVRAGAREAYLLTFSIETLARRHGFERIDRDQVPPRILQSCEFKLTSCQSALIMRKVLDTRLT